MWKIFLMNLKQKVNQDRKIKTNWMLNTLQFVNVLKLVIVEWDFLTLGQKPFWWITEVSFHVILLLHKSRVRREVYYRVLGAQFSRLKYCEYLLTIHSFKTEYSLFLTSRHVIPVVHDYLYTHILSG